MSNSNAFSWDIKETPILDINGDPIKGYKNITRDNDNKTVAVMKDSFVPMTTQMFTDTANEVASRLGGTIKSFDDWFPGSSTKNAGKGKNVITCQIEVSEPVMISGSRVDGILTLGVGFDGSRSFFIGHTNNYLRCTNQFATIIDNFKSRLTKNNSIRIEDVLNRVEIYREFEKQLYVNYNKMMGVKVDERLIQECVARLIKMTDEERLMTEKERLANMSTQKLNKRDELMASLRGEMHDVGNNAWGLLNGVTHYTTHVMKSSGDCGSLFGAKQEANMIAYNFGLELMNA